MKKYLIPKTLILLLVAAIINSCEFEPNGSFSPPVDSNTTPPNISITNLNLYTDTVEVLWDKRIMFNFTSDKQSIDSVVAQINGRKISTIPSHSGYFTIQANNLAIGYHKLKLIIYTKWGSGSMAEELGFEKYIFEKEWTINVSKNSNVKVHNSIEKGFLKLSWTEYKSEEPFDYLVFKGTYGNYDYQLASLKDAVFVDSTYVGEETQYQIKVKTQNNVIHPWATINLQKDLPELFLSPSKQHGYRLGWNKNKYYKAIGAISISQLYNEIANYTNIEDTVRLIEDAIFGAHSYYTLKTVPKYYNPQYVNGFKSEFSTDAQITFTFGNIDADLILKGENDNLLLIKNERNTIAKYSIDKNIIEQQINSSDIVGSIKMSPTRKIFCNYNNNKIYWSSSSNLEDRKIIPLNQPNSHISEIAPSDVGTLLISGYKNENQTINLININTLDTIGTIENYIGYIIRMNITSNGEYILFHQPNKVRLFHFTEGVFTEMELNIELNSIDFHRIISNNQFIVWTNGIFYIINCSTLTIEKEFPLLDSELYDIDLVNKRILAYSNGFFNVRDLYSGNILYQIRALEPYSGCCYLQNNAIISSDGFIHFFN
jgi:hypothetical protein